ncbi:UbiH/UbiF/VisC/COQ6 family ubiquinone biosynthesis hydroxylase, partial [Kaarinaea lacus]
MNKPIETYDVIIIGGGMVGAAFACALADTPLQVALIEGKKPDLQWPKSHYDLRTSALSRASQRILESLEVWPLIEAMRASPYTDMHVWDSSGNGVIHFDCADIGEPSLGHIVENGVILAALYNRLADIDNISILCPTTPRALSKGLNNYTLAVDQGQTLQAKLIVAADGARSWARQSSGIQVQTQDYHQTAVVTNVKTAEHHQYTAWQVFLPTGPLAFLPLNDGYSSIVWSTSPQQAEDLLAMDDTGFKSALKKAFNSTLGEITELSERGAFPLRSLHAKHYVQSGLALIGDAAHTIHPLAGQGVNLGFADAACLVEVILDALRDGKTIGDYHVLRRYERWRKGDNLSMLTAMSAFKTVFGSRSPFMRSGRNLGFNITNRIVPAKNLLIRHAMGLMGDLPKLAK